MPYGYAVVRTTYEKVGSSFQKAGKCAVCGKPAKRSCEFYQTISPFNVHKVTRQLKTRSEIWTEVRAEAAVWQAEPVKHAKCER